MKATDMDLDVVRAEIRGDQVRCFVAIDGSEVSGHIAIGPDGMSPANRWTPCSPG